MQPLLEERTMGQWEREREQVILKKNCPEESRCREEQTEFLQKHLSTPWFPAVISHNTKVSTFVMYFVLHPDKLSVGVSGNDTVKSMRQFYYIYNKKRKHLNNQTHHTHLHAHIWHAGTHICAIHARTHTPSPHACMRAYAQSSINSTFSRILDFFVHFLHYHPAKITILPRKLREAQHNVEICMG